MFKLPLASALPALVLLSPAHAEEAQDSPIVVTASPAAEDPERRPGGTDVVIADTFRDELAVSLRDALDFSPGVYLQPRFGQEVRISIRGSGISRGFHMRGLTLLQDGIAINMADDNGDFQELDPQVFERIEVYRGANALRYGGSTLGGAINAVTPTGRSATGPELRVDGGSYDTVRAKAAYGFATPRGDAYLALTTDHSDGDRDHASRSAWRFNGNAGVRLSDAIETRFYATVSRIRQDLPGSLTRTQALTTPWIAAAASVNGDQARNIDSIRLQNRTTVTLDGATVTVGGFYNAKQLDHPIFLVIDQKSEDRDLFASVDLAGENWEATLGSTARFGITHARNFLNVAGRRGALVSDARQTATTINSYGEFRLTPAAGLTLIAGGIHSHGTRAVTNRLVASGSGRAEFDAFAPKLGVLYQPAADITLFANASRSIELPGYAEVIQTVAGTPRFVPVVPQKAWTFEVGTRGHRGIAQWDISVYRAEIRDEMLQYVVAGDIPASTFNAERTVHQGVEAGLDLTFNPWLQLRQVYQYNDFRFVDDVQFHSNRLPVVPLHQYRGELRVGPAGYSITPRIEWTPEGGWSDYDNTIRAPGYVLFGLGARAKLTEWASGFVDVRNIFDKKAIGDISAVITGSAANFYPVERRAIYLGLRSAL